MINQSRSADTAGSWSALRYCPAPQLDSQPPDAASILNQLSMSQMTTCRWSFQEDVEHYRQVGIRRMSVWRPKLCDEGEQRCAERLREAGISVSSLGWAGGFTGSQGHSYEAAVDDACDAVRTAASLGAETLTIISGAQHGHIRTHARRLLMEGLAEVLDLASEYGVTLALQPMHHIFREDWTFLNTLDETLEILSRFDHPYLGMAFGTYHLWQEPWLSQRLPAIVPFIASVQVSDWRRPRCDNDRYLPGDGVIPLSEILSTLHRYGYSGSYEMELWSAELWQADPQEVLIECRDRFVSLFHEESVLGATD